MGPTWPPIQWVLGAPSLGIKWFEHEADHSPPRLRMHGAIKDMKIMTDYRK